MRSPTLFSHLLGFLFKCLLKAWRSVWWCLTCFPRRIELADTSRCMQGLSCSLPSYPCASLTLLTESMSSQGQLASSSSPIYDVVLYYFLASLSMDCWLFTVPPPGQNIFIGLEGDGVPLMCNAWVEEIVQTVHCAMEGMHIVQMCSLHAEGCAAGEEDGFQMSDSCLRSGRSMMTSKKWSPSMERCLGPPSEDR
jgi:hypothetical protein